MMCNSGRRYTALQYSAFGQKRTPSSSGRNMYTGLNSNPTSQAQREVFGGFEHDKFWDPQ